MDASDRVFPAEAGSAARHRRELVCLLCHDWTPSVARAARRLAESRGSERDVVILMQSDDPAAEAAAAADPAGLPLRRTTTETLLDRRWGSKTAQAARALLPGHADLLDLAAADLLSRYERYWRIEYDVVFTGPWERLFDHFAASSADLLTTTVRRLSDDTGWRHADSLHWPGAPPAPAAQLIAFMPIARVSRAALETVARAYRSGVTGHLETVWPTAVARAGLAVEDIGGDGRFVEPGNRGRFYFNTPHHDLLSPGSFVYRPVRRTVPNAPETLWHPVKEADAAEVAPPSRHAARPIPRRLLGSARARLWRVVVAAWVLHHRLRRRFDATAASRNGLPAVLPRGSAIQRRAGRPAE
jgi:hypothetical protein